MKDIAIIIAILAAMIVGVWISARGLGEVTDIDEDDLTRSFRDGNDDV